MSYKLSFSRAVFAARRYQTPFQLTKTSPFASWKTARNSLKLLCCHLSSTSTSFAHSGSERFNPTDIKDSFHKRVLPANLIAMSSPNGKSMFREALADGHMESFFPLSEQFITQSEPAFCSLSSMAMVLNALNHDPGRIWKGPWRWITEETLQCETQDVCGHSLQSVRDKGMSFSEFESLAACHGVNMKTYRVADPGLQLQAVVPIEGRALDVHHHDRHCGKHAFADCQHHHHGEPHSKHDIPKAQRSESPTTRTQHASHSYHNHPQLHGNPHGTISDVTVDVTDRAAVTRFRRYVEESARAVDITTFVIVNFSRKSLDQTGDGHFSPIGGYHRASDSVLVMDTARFKYPPFWVPLIDLWKAMGVPDTLTGEGRGYFVVESSRHKKSA
jgi:hypothetical protein